MYLFAVERIKDRKNVTPARLSLMRDALQNILARGGATFTLQAHTLCIGTSATLLD